MNLSKVQSSETTFGSLNVKEASSVLYSRLKSPQKYIEYDRAYRFLEKSPCDVVLKKGKYNSLVANVKTQNGGFTFIKKEPVYRGFLKLSPNKFLNKVCEIVSEILKK